MIRNILLDLDDTLLDFRKSEEAALSKTLRHIGLEPRPEILARYSEINHGQWKLLELGEITLDEVKLRRFHLLFNELGVDYSPKQATEYFEHQLGNVFYYVEGSEHLLKSLRGSYRLYLVTNGSSTLQRRRIESSGIGGYLNGIFISQELGFTKPSTGYFNRCFSQIPQFKKQETLILGNSLTSDIKGANKSGITSVWFNPNGSKESQGIVPDYQIKRLSEFIPLLEGL